jgi:hypothetical protein
LERLRRFNKELEEEERLPITEKILFEGRASKFYEADLGATTLDACMVKEIEKLPTVYEAFGALGFEHLGDLVCEKIGGAIICAFASSDECAFAAHYVLPYMTGWKDIFTPFEDGTSLTTSNGMNEGSIAKLRILEHHCDTQDIEELVSIHRNGRNILQKHGIEKAQIDPTVEGFARVMDEFLVKRLAEE